jgi:hypothetical protein
MGQNLWEYAAKKLTNTGAATDTEHPVHVRGVPIPDKIYIEKDIRLAMHIIWCKNCHEILAKIPDYKLDEAIQLAKTIYRLAKTHPCFREEGLDENGKRVRFIRTL